MGNCCTVVVPSSSLNSKPSEHGLAKCDIVKVLRIQRGFRKFIRAKLKRKEFYKRHAIFGYDCESAWEKNLNFSYSELRPNEIGLNLCLNRIRDFYYKYLSPYGFIGDFIVDLDDSADHDLEGNPIVYKEFSEASLLSIKNESDFIKQFYFFILTFANTKFKLSDAPNLMFMANQQFVFRFIKKDTVLAAYMSKIKNTLERENVLDDFFLYCLHYKIGGGSKDKEIEIMAKTSKSTDSRCNQSFDRFGLSSSSIYQHFNISKSNFNIDPLTKLTFLNSRCTVFGKTSSLFEENILKFSSTNFSNKCTEDGLNFDRKETINSLYESYRSDLPGKSTSKKNNQVIKEIECYKSNSDLNVDKNLNSSQLFSSNSIINDQSGVQKKSKPITFCPRNNISIEKILSKEGNFYYKGEWNDESYHMDGLGCLYIIQDSKALEKYCGYFKNSNYFTAGIKVNCNGLLYAGEFIDGYEMGYGEKYTSSFIYQGLLKEGQFEGLGTLVSNGNRYFGTFSNGKKHGLGHQIDSTKRVSYVGSFVNNSCQGIGLTLYDLESEVKDNNIKLLPGSRYKYYYGDHLYGKMQGYGKLVFKNGESYEGNFDRDLQHGEGVYTMLEDKKLKGNWVDGRKEGWFEYSNSKDVFYLKFRNDVQVQSTKINPNKPK